ncbi:hypothetical protein CASFOL_021075 [Castilleja foliolosa]|uniref:Uncharacterized protein n=1 Tax=Castilleja foliolosa TaxID=1961234 RepID=A0ABD3CXG5_9LAMI
MSLLYLTLSAGSMNVGNGYTVFKYHNLDQDFQPYN